MPIAAFDGSFEGFLCTLKYCQDNKLEQVDFHSDKKEYSFCFDEIKEVATDFQIAEEYFALIADRISLQTAKIVMMAFLAEEENLESKILDYLNIAFKIGIKVNDYLSNPSVLSVIKAYRRVGSEAHHYQGLIRFRKLKDEIYYASFEPKNNILCLLTQHFSDRFACQKWVIHDIKRKMALVYDGEYAEMVEVTEFNPGVSYLQQADPLFFASEEDELQDLWKGYFKAIAIKERINPKLQRQNMPKKYWKYLVEKS